MCRFAAVLIIVACFVSPTMAEEKRKLNLNQLKKTYVYKTVDEHEIKADVYFDPASEAPRPVVLHLHGGALINGERNSVRGLLPNLEGLLNEGFAVVSADYRLAPETKLPKLIEDIQDSYIWILEKGPELFGVDPNRIGVEGGSAGGYLTLMTGFCVETRPRALVSFFGYGDLVGEWYSKPDPFYCKMPLIPAEEAYGGVNKGVISGAIGKQNPGRGRFYLFCRQNGIWPKEVTGLDRETELDAFKRFCPDQNVTSLYPPTLLGHGTEDTDVPYELSVRMAEALEEAGVEHEFITLEGAGHGFKGMTQEEMREQFVEPALAFLVKHVKNAKSNN